MKTIYKRAALAGWDIIPNGRIKLSERPIIVSLRHVADDTSASIWQLRRGITCNIFSFVKKKSSSLLKSC